MKVLRVFLTISLLQFALFTYAGTPPDDTIIAKAYSDNPTNIYEMVRKLYVIEHAVPEIQYPPFTLIAVEDKDGDYLLRVESEDVMKIFIGDADYNLQYDVEIKKQIVNGYIPDVSIPLSVKIAIGITGGTALFVCGLLVGLQF